VHRVPLPFLVFLVLAASISPPALAGGIVTQPPGSDLIITSPGPESPSLIEHFPFENLISWEIFLNRGRCYGSPANPGTCSGGPDNANVCTSNANCGSAPLTFTGGEARLYDADGNLIDVNGNITGMGIPITPTLFEQTARWFGNKDEGVPDNVRLADLGLCQGDNAQLCVGPGSDDVDRCGSTGNNACDPRPSAGFVPANSNLGIPFPFEKLRHNVLAFSSGMDLCFAEFDNPPGTCKPLQITNVALTEYRHQGQTYIYPLGNPSIAGGTLFSGPGGGHEINTNHRLARNQRYAYDVGVLLGGSDRSGTGSVNTDYFIYEEPVFAMADGDIVTLEKGHVENDMPPDLGFGGFCESRRCDGMTTDTCSTEGPGAADDIIPGSGNSLVVQHDSEEHTGYAHMKTGSNDLLACFGSLNRGDQIGVVGNSGSSSAPHIHFGSLDREGPEDNNNYGFPTYWNNVQFASRQGDTPRRQLDTGMPTLPDRITWTILAPPVPLPANPSMGSGSLIEAEPNDLLADHDTIEVPAIVSATLEDADVGEMAVRGDAIEDIFRVELSGPDSLRFDLVAANPGANLDLYLLNEDLLVLNETQEGTSPSGIERACFELDAGAYYAFVSNVDLTRNGDEDYELSVESDPQTIAVTIEQGADSIEVDAQCEATVEFAIDLHDNCCLDPSSELALGLVVTPSNPTGNLTIGTLTLDPPQVLSESDLLVTGRVEVSDLTSCPAVLQIDARAQDCQGNVVDTEFDGGNDAIDIFDTMPPVVTSNVTESRLWPPNHGLVDVGFERTATDNCDADVAQSLITRAWADEAETVSRGAGRHAPDAKDLDGDVKLRAERQGTEDGRVYLLTSSAMDACDNRAFACTTVSAAHDRSAASEARLAAQEADAQQVCEGNGGAPPLGFWEIGLSKEVGPKQ
jgi:hypothetical protein